MWVVENYLLNFLRKEIGWIISVGHVENSKNIQVQYVWGEKSPQIEGRCKECLVMDKAISSLYQDFVWTCDSDMTQVEIKEKEDKALDKIIKLPKEQLKEFLIRMNSGIER